MSCFIFHTWGPWEQYDSKMMFVNFDVNGQRIPYIEVRQKRICLKCSKMQDETVKEGVRE